VKEGCIRYLLCLTFLTATSCSRPLKSARLSALEPVSQVEEEAEIRHNSATCSLSWGLLFPGLSQYCAGQEKDAYLLSGLGAMEVGLSLWAGNENGFDHSSAQLPLLAFQDLWVYGFSQSFVDMALANHERYAPQDTLYDLVAAPWNWAVIKRTDVWLGTLFLTAVGVGLTLYMNDGIHSDFGADPRILGEDFSPLAGYSLGSTIGAGLFTHVAVAEEMLFRGTLQSGLARKRGELQGWLGASFLFGVTHALNVFALPASERTRYLAIAVPYITVTGSYLGWRYKESGYSLSVPVAIHFWYDFLLSAVFFAADPRNSPISAKISVPF